MSSKKLPTKALELLEGNQADYKSVIHSQERKLSEDQQMEMIELIARFAPNGKIVEHFYTKYKIIISPTLIQQYKRTTKWQPVIKKLREKYVLGVDEVAGMHKRVRLERADEIYHKALEQGKLRLALAANKDQREEVFEKQAGGSVTYNLNQFNQFVNMTDEELEEKKREILTKIKKAEVLSEGQP